MKTLNIFIYIERDTYLDINKTYVWRKIFKIIFNIHSFIFMLNNWHLPIYLSLCACYSAIYLLNHINGDDFHTHIHIHMFKSLCTKTIFSNIVK